MKSSKIYIMSVQLRILTISSLSFAITDSGDDLPITQPTQLEVQRGNAGSFRILNRDVVNLIGQRLEFNEFKNLRQACHYIEHSTRALIQARAQAEIAALTGELVEVEAGSYIKGSPADEADIDYFVSNEAPHYVQIEKPFLMQKHQVTQGQYTRLMGNEHLDELHRWATHFKMDPSLSIGDKKPITHLTRDEEDTYIEKLNLRLKNLWPIAHPTGSRALVRLKRPTDDQWEYVTTRRLAEPQKVEMNGKQMEITAEHQLYPVELPDHRDWKEGPRDVDAPELKVSERGIQGLARSTGEVTSTNFFDGSFDFVLRGGHWHCFQHQCRSASRESISPVCRRTNVGLRLVSDLP